MSKLTTGYMGGLGAVSMGRLRGWRFAAGGFRPGDLGWGIIRGGARSPSLPTRVGPCCRRGCGRGCRGCQRLEVLKPGDGDGGVGVEFEPWKRPREWLLEIQLSGGGGSAMTVGASSTGMSSVALVGWGAVGLAVAGGESSIDASSVVLMGCGGAGSAKAGDGSLLSG